MRHLQKKKKVALGIYWKPVFQLYSIILSSDESQRALLLLRYNHSRAADVISEWSG